MPPRTSSILPIHKSSTPPTTDSSPRRHFLPERYRNELLAFVSEFCGTFMFLFLAFGGTQVANTNVPGIPRSGAAVPNTSALLFIALSFGFSLAVNVWVFFRVSGGLFNPAVTLGLLLTKTLTPLRAANIFLAQLLAGMASAGVVSAILPGPLNVSTKLAAGTSIARGLFLEMFLTAQLVFTIFMLAAEKHKATFLAPIGIGLSMFVAELVGVLYTGGSLNPTRSFGPCVVLRSFPGYHYIYWIGPCLGSLLAFAVYKLIKEQDYETVNPGQDFDDHETELFDPPDNPTSPDDVARPNPAAEGVLRVVSPSSGSKQGRREESSSLGSPRIPGNQEKAEGSMV